ncbi:PapG carbohydrate binding domain-containing protein [Escherichia coli]|uniref:PapG carbohydrate binding domain-containing protein n=1 Tax=Escherichia coli TaxID=562 RepID=UPI0028615EC5|nr:fimbrial protein [Escherichia coli]HCB2789254.1 fimbrial protein [Escherichia coli]HDW2448911.1 fimbrial protein [Escherichia coli]HDW2612574.1 fimbrial protein [Escherichia coli]HEG2060092.1 fimbrial protein [Escherichia coli]
MLNRILLVASFLLVFNCNYVFSAYRSTVFYTFDDNLYTSRGNLVVTDSIQPAININGTSTSTLTYRECNGFTYSHGLYWSEYFAWLVIPKTVVFNGYHVFIDIYNRGRWSLDSQDNENYYLTQGYIWDQVHGGGATVCGQIGNTLNTSWSFGPVVLNVYLPPDIPKGSNTITVPFLRGIQQNNFDYLGGRHKIPSGLMKTFPFKSKFNIQFNNVGGCRPSVQSLDIEHGNVNINNANGHQADKSISVYCDVPARINFSLLPNTPGTYSYLGTSVGLGNGWDSIVSLDGVERDKETITWSSAGSKTITVGSRLYGESGRIKPGSLSGSMTMVLSIR